VFRFVVTEDGHTIEVNRFFQAVLTDFHETKKATGSFFGNELSNIPELKKILYKSSKRDIN